MKELLIRTARAAPASPQRDGLVDHLTHAVAHYPQLVEVGPRVHLQTHVVRYQSSDGAQSLNAVLDVTLPCGRSKMIWLPWLPHQAQPARLPGEYHPMQLFGRTVLMPRRTRAHGSTFGDQHPLESDTQPAIHALYDEINVLFGYPPNERVNVCFENDYDNGRHHVSAHSDDEVPRVGMPLSMCALTFSRPSLNSASCMISCAA